jgi:hypothetical protein
MITALLAFATLLLLQSVGAAAGTGDIIMQAAAAGAFAKVLVDAVKATPLYTVSWVLLLLAFAFGQACSFMLAMSTGDGMAFTSREVSSCVLVGILAFGSAVGLTELQRKADQLNNAG